MQLEHKFTNNFSRCFTPLARITAIIRFQKLPKLPRDFPNFAEQWNLTRAGLRVTMNTNHVLRKITVTQQTNLRRNSQSSETCQRQQYRISTDRVTRINLPFFVLRCFRHEGRQHNSGFRRVIAKYLGNVQFTILCSDSIHRIDQRS